MVCDGVGRRPRHGTVNGGLICTRRDSIQFFLIGRRHQAVGGRGRHCRSGFAGQCGSHDFVLDGVCAGRRQRIIYVHAAARSDFGDFCLDEGHVCCIVRLCICRGFKASYVHRDVFWPGIKRKRVVIAFFAWHDVYGFSPVCPARQQRYVAFRPHAFLVDRPNVCTGYEFLIGRQSLRRVVSNRPVIDVLLGRHVVILGWVGHFQAGNGCHTSHGV